MAFPSPHMNGLDGGHHPGVGSMQMLPAPPGMMPPTRMGLHGHGGQMQLAHRGNMTGFGQPSPHDAMLIGSPALSAGHPSPMLPMQMQQLQAAGMQGMPQGHRHLLGAGPSAYGQPGSGNMHHPAQMVNMQMPPHMSAQHPSHMQAQQAQAMQNLHGMHQQQHRQSALPPQEASFPSGPHASGPYGMSSTYPGNAGASSADPSFPVVVPQMDDQTGMLRSAYSSTSSNSPSVIAAYVMGGTQPMNLSGRLQGQGANSASAQQSGNGEFDMEQEVTVKTKLKGRGTFSGNMNGSMQDSINAGLKLDAGGAFGSQSAYPSSLPAPYDSRMLGQQPHGMYGGAGVMQNGPHEMAGYPGTPQTPMGRSATPF